MQVIKITLTLLIFLALAGELYGASIVSPKSSHRSQITHNSQNKNIAKKNSSSSSSSSSSSMKSIFKSLKTQLKPSKNLETALIESLNTNTKTTNSNSDANFYESTRSRRYLDELLALLSALIMREFHRITRINSNKLKTSASKETIPVLEHQKQQLSSSSLNYDDDDDEIDANPSKFTSECLRHIQSLSSLSSQGQVKWLCELGPNFDSSEVKSDENFCTCSHAYECVEHEQFYLDEIELDQSSLSSAASIVETCETSMLEVTDMQWNCTVDLRRPTSSQLFCECKATKTCEFQKILFFKEFML